MRVDLVLLGLTLLAACPVAQVCDDSAHPSVNVSVFVGNGEPVDGAIATYSVDGAPPTGCIALDPGEFTCGLEESGTITVIASATGYREASAEVLVEEDECHVLTEQLDLELVRPEG